MSSNHLPMGRDRFFIGVIAGIVLLILVALVLFFIRQNQSANIDETTPAGVVSSYVLAIQHKDFEKAYSYLAEGTNRPSLLAFQSSFLAYQGAEAANTPVEIGEEIIDKTGETAAVQITLVHGGRSFLDDVYRESQIAQVVKSGPTWKIMAFPYPYWSYDWSAAITPKPLPTPAQ